MEKSIREQQGKKACTIAVRVSTIAGPTAGRPLTDRVARSTLDQPFGKVNDAKVWRVGGKGKKWPVHFPPIVVPGPAAGRFGPQGTDRFQDVGDGEATPRRDQRDRCFSDAPSTRLVATSSVQHVVLRVHSLLR